jgi:hypothetical protein
MSDYPLLSNKDLIKVMYAMAKDMWSLSLNNTQACSDYNNMMRTLKPGDIVIEISTFNPIDVENSIGYYVSGKEPNEINIIRLSDLKPVKWGNAIFVKIPVTLVIKEKSIDSKK